MNMNNDAKDNYVEDIHNQEDTKDIQCPCMAKMNGMKPKNHHTMAGVNLKGNAGNMPGAVMSNMNNMMPGMGMPYISGMMPCMNGMGMPDMNNMMPEMNMTSLNTEDTELSPEAKSLLVNLMEIDFALVEFNLYLDTHPFDCRALVQYNNYLAMRPPILRRLQELYGPITILQRIKYPWAWLNQPWPWRINF